MFETGMSALVLKICSEYAKALGLNFPPCVQQEINAIAQYVDLHTVKDLKVEQNGSVVTITCFTEGEQEKVFTVTLPDVNVDTLSALLKGSSSVVVDKSEDGRTLVVRLDKSQEVQYINLHGGKTLSTDELNILKANKNNQIIYYGGVKYYFKFAYEKTSSEWIYTSFYNGIVTLTVNMTTGSSIFDTESGGGKMYLHYIYFNNATNFPTLVFYSTSSNRVTDKWIYDNLANKYNLTIFPTLTSITAFGGIGLIRKIIQTSSSPSWGANIDLSSPTPTTLSVSESTKYDITEV